MAEHISNSYTFHVSVDLNLLSIFIILITIHNCELAVINMYFKY